LGEFLEVPANGIGQFALLSRQRHSVICAFNLKQTDLLFSNERRNSRPSLQAKQIQSGIVGRKYQINGNAPLSYFVQYTGQIIFYRDSNEPAYFAGRRGTALEGSGE
jgi:hypothetical protein